METFKVKVLVTFIILAVFGSVFCAVYFLGNTLKRNEEEININSETFEPGDVKLDIDFDKPIVSENDPI